MCEFLAELPDHKIKKSFIPQLYHLLQDYGLFLEYMDIVNNDEKDKDMSLLRKNVNNWLLNTGENMGRYSVRERVLRYREMMTNIRRVEFLRSFNTVCCKDKKNKHEDMDIFLNEIYEAIEGQAERLEKSYIY